MKVEKSILISWTAHMFREVMLPIIYELYKNFHIVLVINDFHISKELHNDFRDLKNKKIIKAFFIIPPYSKIRKQFKYLKDNTKLLKSYNFDYWLTPSEMQIDERYIFDFVITKKCYVIVLAHTVTYLFERIDILSKLIPEEISMLKGEKDDLRSEKEKTKKSLIHKIGLFFILRKLIKIKYKHIFLLHTYIKSKFIKKYKNFIQKYYYRIILPWLKFGKTFNLGPYDQLTQVGSGKSDLFLFTDPLEVKAHKKLFQKDEIVTTQYPSYGNCSCKNRNPKKNVLILLGGVFMRESVPMQVLKLFLRDSLIVYNETKPDCFHLRLHPRMNKTSPQMLKEFLEKNGIPTKISEPNKSIREIICSYIGVAGLSSNGLRDARASCDFAFVTGFEAVSKLRYPDPKLMYGIGEGISWINEDGSYDPKIFKREKYIPPKRKSVPEIINALSGNNNLYNYL